MKKLLLGLFLLAASFTGANAQCTGAFPTGYICGNNTGATSLPRPTAITNGFLVLPDGQIFVGDNTNRAQGRTPSGDCTITDLGVLTCTKTGGVNFGPFATATDLHTQISHFNSGTSASTTTFWRGDGTWAAPQSCQAVQVSKSADYPVVQGDNGTMFVVTNRSTISFPNVYTQNFCVNIFNNNVGKSVTVSVNGVSYFLWPGQVETVFAGPGGTLAYTGPHRYALTNTTLIIAPVCSDSNDGLSGSGAICSINTAVKLLQTSFDGLGTNPAIQLADGSYTQAAFNAGYGPHATDAINLLGHSGSVGAVVLLAPAGQTALAARDYGAWIAQDFTLGCIAAGATGINASQFGVVDIQNITLGSCDGNVMLIAQDGGHINFETGIIIAGNGADFALAQNVGSLINMTNQTITCSGSPAFSFFANAQLLGMINGTGAVFSSCGGVAAQRYTATVNAVVYSAGGGANFYPGNVAGTTANGGQYQ